MLAPRWTGSALGIAVALVAATALLRPAPSLARSIASAADAALEPSAPLDSSPSVPATPAERVAQPELAVRPAPPSADVPMAHVWQSLNNCGPAAVTMALSTFGISVSQEEARLALRGPDWRRGMGPAPVEPWVRSEFGLRSIARTGGTHALLKLLISNGFAPMVTQWMEDPSVSRIAHWRTVRGYDDAAGAFYANDSMRGVKVPLSYPWFAENWQPFSYRFMVIYRREDEPLLRAILGDDWYDAPNRFRYYDRARIEAGAHDTPSAWLAYGEAAYQVGRFEEAVTAFERGMALGSATGVFNVRSSYPAALRYLGR